MFIFASSLQFIFKECHYFEHLNNKSEFRDSHSNRKKEIDEKMIYMFQ
jgi:hypothetical protein